MLDSKQNLWRPAIFCSLAGALGVKLTRELLVNCNIHSNELISLVSEGFLFKNDDYEVRHERWATEFLTYVFYKYFNNDAIALNNSYGLGSMVNCLFENLNVDAIITVMIRCSSFISETKYQSLASILINNSTIPENLTNSNTVNIHCFGYGNYYSSAKEFKKAIEAYDRALQINQLHVPSWVNKGSVYSKMGKPAMTFLI